MPIIEKELGFDAGHRLLNHEGKCANLHGHRYRAIIRVEAPALDAVGRVIDFGAIKEVVGGWIARAWDHGYIGQDGDPMVDLAERQGLKVHRVKWQPTAENMAAYLFAKSNQLFNANPQSPLRVTRVTLYETPTSSAVAEDGFIGGVSALLY